MMSVACYRQRQGQGQARKPEGGLTYGNTAGMSGQPLKFLNRSSIAVLQAKHMPLVTGSCQRGLAGSTFAPGACTALLQDCPPKTHGQVWSALAGQLE